MTTVIDGLLTDSSRTFSFSELEYFKMWWDIQGEKRKQQVKELIESGQLEIVNGGFSSTDEACPTYDMMINNYY